MRSEWVPVSAGALVTGVMAFILAQMLNPAGPSEPPEAQLVLAAENAGRWLAMSALYFFGAVALILGVPTVLTLFAGLGPGRGLATVGATVLALGCLGVAGMSGLMLMFRALALQVLAQGIEAADVQLVVGALANPALQVMLQVWVYGFFTGVLLIALGLFRARVTARWVPSLLLLYLAAQFLVPVAGAADRTVAAIGLLLLAAGFTGVATRATAPH